MKNFNTSTKVLVGAALVASVGAASAMNIVVNGSFELGNNAVGGFDEAGGIGISGVTGVGSAGRTQQIANWTVTNGQLIWLENGYAGGTGALSTPYGTRFLDMTALTNDASQYAKIEQTLNVTASTIYTLTFAVGSSNAIRKCGTSCGDTKVDVTAGSFMQTVNVGTPTLSNIWTPVTTSFTTAAAGPMTLSLTFRGLQGDDYIGLDNISVTAVPEPTSLAMLFAGLAAVGTVVARRRGQNS